VAARGSVATPFCSGREEGMAAGREEDIGLGKTEGAASLLRGLLTVKFGSLGEEVDARLRAASLAELARWSERFLTADSLADVFGE
jgi:hypothetical protein